MTHPVGQALVAALDGRFPPPDGGWTQVEPWTTRAEAVLAFTGHALLAVREVPATVMDRIDGLGGAHDPRVLTALAGQDGWIDSLDLVVIGTGTGAGGPLVPRPDLDDHPRAALARSLRADVAVYGLADRHRSALVTLGRGIGGLAELSFELEPQARGTGRGTALVRSALGLVPAGEPVLAAVAPGNTASLRVALRAGFVPVASVQLFRR